MAKSRDTDSPTHRLLYSRSQTGELLGGISYATIKRLEKDKRLTPIRLNRSPSSMVFYKATEVLALVDTASGARNAA